MWSCMSLTSPSYLQGCGDEPAWKPNSASLLWVYVQKLNVLGRDVVYSVCHSLYHSLAPCTKPLLPFMLAAGSENTPVWFPCSKTKRKTTSLILEMKAFRGLPFSSCSIPMTPSRQSQSGWPDTCPVYLSLPGSYYLSRMLPPRLFPPKSYLSSRP